MNKEQLKKLQSELNSISEKKFSKLTDKQLAQYDSMEFKNGAKTGGRIGGPKAGKIAKENKLGFHSMKKEDRVKLSKEIGNRIGPRSKQEGFGIFGLSKKETIKNAIAGGKASAKSKKHPNNVKVKCEHCGFKTSLPLYKRWHGNNCKHK